MRFSGPTGPTLSLLILLQAVGTALFAADTPVPVDAPDLPRIVERLRSVTGVPGLAVAVADESGSVRSFTAGSAVLEHDVPVTDDTRFRLASTSKAVTAVALASLSDSGVLNLDDTVGTHLPDLPEPLHPITLRQLAGHLGGVRHYAEDEGSLDLQRWGSAGDAVEIFSRDPLLAEPGEAYHYSTFGYTLLAAVMEAATGKSFQEIVRDEVAEPLGLTSLARDDPRAIVPGRAAFYERAPDGTLLRAPFVDPSYKVAGGGLLVAARDLARLGQALLRGSVLSERSREALFRSQLTSSGHETGVGLGWRIGSDPLGRTVWHHEGSMAGARSAVLVYPEQGWTVAVLSNLSTTPFFVFETGAAIAGILEGDGLASCSRPFGGTFRGTATLDGQETTAELTIEAGETTLHGSLRLGRLPVPVSEEIPVAHGWCRTGETTLVLALGPHWGLLPVTLRQTDDRLSAELVLQGGHRFTLSLAGRF